MGSQMKLKASRLILAGWILSCTHMFAWDYEGHRMVNQLALAALPPVFPKFVQEPVHAARIAFLAGEPDRWRNTPEVALKHANELDHFIDIEHVLAAGLNPRTLPATRYTFAMEFAAGRARHADKFVAVDPAKNQARTLEWPGFLPWAIAENYGKLKSAFSYLKTFEETGGTEEEIAHARANIAYYMGVLGHYVGDGAQPLHTTENHNGWVHANPQGYTTWGGFHSWIDGGFIAKAGITLIEIAPRMRVAGPLSLATRHDGRDPLIMAIMTYLIEQHGKMEPLYQLDKAGKLRADIFPVAIEGRTFITTQIQIGGEMLAALWVSAWKSAGTDTYLRAQLLKRRAAAQVQ